MKVSSRYKEECICDEVTSVDRAEIIIGVHLLCFEESSCFSMEVVSIPSPSPHTQLVTSRGRRDGAVGDVNSASYKEVTFYWQGAGQEAGAGVIASKMAAFSNKAGWRRRG